MKLFIPKKLIVGFQNREGTFTGKLAYVIYYDEKGTLRKQNSWNSWRDSKIEPIELDNTPRNGYVLNKGIHRYGHWGGGRNVIRVYDPRDFEFEITVDNLIGILMHSDVSKRDIVEECVFAWAGSELVLLPISSEDYKESIEYTHKQDKNLSAKDLKKGFVYSKKKSDEKLTYIGYHHFYENLPYAFTGSAGAVQHDKGKRHIFWDGINFVIPSIQTLASSILDEPVAEYPDLIDKFMNGVNSAKIVDIAVNDIPKGSFFYKKLDNTTFIIANFYEQHYGNFSLNTWSFRDWFIKMNVINGNDCQLERIELPYQRGYFTYRNLSDLRASVPEAEEFCNAAKALNIDLKNFSYDEAKAILINLGYGGLTLKLDNGKEMDLTNRY